MYFYQDNPSSAGTTYILGELKVEREPGNPSKGIYDAYKFRLTMIRLQMGCLATGSVSVTPLDSNGSGGRN